MHSDDRAIAISATFTAEAIQPGLAFWAGELGLDYEIRFAGYNQLFPVTARLRRPVCPQSRRLQRSAGALRGLAARRGRGRPGGARAELVEAVRCAAASFPAPLIVAVCPATPAHELPALSGLERVLCRGRCRPGRGPSAHALSEFEALYPVDGDPRSARRRTGPSALHAGILRGAGDGHRAPDPRHRHAAIQSRRARLR